MTVTVSIGSRSVALSAIADPTRMAILALLRQRDHCVCHLVEVLGIKQSAISHHIGILRRAGIIMAHPHPTDRRWLYYRINRQALSGVAEYVGWLLDDGDYDPTPLPCGADEPIAEDA